MSVPGMLPRCRDKTLSYGRPSRGNSHRAAKRSATALSSNQVCTAGGHSVRTMARSARFRGAQRRGFCQLPARIIDSRVSPRTCSRRTIACRRTSLARKYDSRANIALLRVHGARARACTSERESLRACLPTGFQGLGIYYIYDHYPSPATCVLARDD